MSEHTNGIAEAGEEEEEEWRCEALRVALGGLLDVVEANVVLDSVVHDGVVRGSPSEGCLVEEK